MNSYVPYIVLSGKSTPRGEDNIRKFRAVTAVVKNKDTGKYLALKFVTGEYGLVGGNVEAGESNDTAILREVTEESGYTNPIIESIIFEEAQCRGYKARKSIDELVTEKVYSVIVSEENHSDNLDEEEGIDSLHWLSADQILAGLTLEHHLYYFRAYLNQQHDNK